MEYSVEFRSGWGLGRAAARRSKELIGCPCKGLAFKSRECAEILAKATAMYIRDAQRHGYLTTRDSIEGFSAGFFRENWEICGDGAPD
jgi:hypothetical protein